MIPQLNFSTGTVSHQSNCDQDVAFDGNDADATIPGGVSPRPNAHMLPSPHTVARHQQQHQPESFPSRPRRKEHHAHPATTSPESSSSRVAPSRLRPLRHSQIIHKGSSVNFVDYSAEGTEVPGADTVSAVRFSPNGQYLAYGDCGGYLHLAVLVQGSASSSSTSEGGFPFSYKPLGFVEAYRRTIDPLNSMPIQERVNKICWFPQSTRNLMLLTTNDKIAKLWKVVERRSLVASEPGEGATSMLLGGGGGAPSIPRTAPTSSITIKETRALPMEHEFSVHTVSVDAEARYFMTCDDLSMRLWCAERLETSVEVLNIKPDDLQTLNETIVSASYHPTNPYLLWYTTSAGVVNIFDTRTSLNCTNPSIWLESARFPPPELTDAFHRNVTASVSCACASPVADTGHVIATRDFLTTKLWDLRFPSEPRSQVLMHKAMIPSLDVLHEQETVFDKFDIAFSGTGRSLYTGSYRHEMLHISATDNGNESTNGNDNNNNNNSESEVVSYRVVPPSRRSTRSSPPSVIQPDEDGGNVMKCRSLCVACTPPGASPSPDGRDVVAATAGASMAIMVSTSTSDE
eukprot:PhM_4_TR14420/c1_g1_i1/m.24302/K04354/PPP2R2; serine/threonine-protein phosphatase 2A regulatory subunit B